MAGSFSLAGGMVPRMCSELARLEEVAVDGEPHGLPGEAEPVEDTGKLDPKKHGLIVQCGYRRGLLLPDLEGVDTVWHLAANGDKALALADVVAWQIVPGAGPAGRSWFQVPALVSLPLDVTDLPAASSEETAVLVFLGDVVPGRSAGGQQIVDHDHPLRFTKETWK